MARKRTSRKAMQSWVTRFERSGLSAARFCRRHGVEAQRLSYWRRVVGRASRAAAGESDRRRVRLAPVQVLDLAVGGSAAARAGIEIQLVSGERLLVREGVSAELLRETLLALRAGC